MNRWACGVGNARGVMTSHRGADTDRTVMREASRMDGVARRRMNSDLQKIANSVMQHLHLVQRIRRAA
jgi:hypothetical protein